MIADGAKTQWSLRDWTFPEEDRALFTTTPWRPGEFRWFRSPNVVPIEQWWRRRQANNSVPASPPPPPHPAEKISS
jgi:hypothetical protein